MPPLPYAVKYADKIELIPITDILIEDRQRTTYDEAYLDELAESIQLIGLINPILITLENRLVAGGCRIKAHERLGRSHIKAIRCENLEPWELVAIELIENLYRRDLPYQDEVSAKRKFHELYLSNVEPKKTLGGATSQRPAWRIANTASLLNISVGSLCQDIELAKAIESNPTLGKFKHKSQAWSAHKRTQQQNARQIMAALTTLTEEELGEDVSPAEDSTSADSASAPTISATFTHKQCTLYNLPCLDIVDKLSDNSVACIITDPPWQVAYDSTFGTSPDVGLKLTEEFLAAVRPKLSPSFQGWLFGATRHLIPGTLYNLLTRLNFFVAPQMMLWHKPGVGATAHAFTELKNDYEPILWFSTQPVRHINKASGSVQLFQNKVRLHPAQKPVGLISHLIELSTVPGELILDPFAGSGVLGYCANKLQRRSVLAEKERSTYLTARGLLTGTLSLMEDSPNADEKSAC